MNRLTSPSCFTQKPEGGLKSSAGSQGSVVGTCLQPEHTGKDVVGPKVCRIQDNARWNWLGSLITRSGYQAITSTTRDFDLMRDEASARRGASSIQHTLMVTSHRPLQALK